MKEYQRYIDLDLKWLKEMPSEWNLLKPKYLFNKVDRVPFENDEIITCFRDGTVTLRKNRREDGFTNSLQEIGYQRIHKGDLVIHEMDGFEGSIGVSDSTGKCTPVYTVIEPNEKYDVKYFMYLLREMAKTRYIESLSKSIRERTTEFRWNVWSDLYFPIPSVNEQNRISSFLDQKTSIIDDLIQKKLRKIELLKEYRTSIINIAITKGLNSDVKMKDSGVESIGEIPIHWIKKRLKHICDIYGRIGYRGYTTDDIVGEGEGVVTISPGNIKNDIFTLDSVTYLSFEKYYESPEIMIFPKDIILVKTGSTIGKTAIIPENSPLMTLNPQLIVLKNIQIDNDYLYYQTICNFFKLFFEIEQTGGTTPTISQEKVNMFPVIIPPLSEQQQIVEYLDKKTSEINKQVDLENRKIDLLKEYRQSLISEVVTGKIDVRTK